MASLVVALGLGGCAGNLASARAEFRAGKYGEAREHLEALEAKAKTWSEPERATYALYRGLAHHALGDRARAQRWLGEAKALEDARPHTLSPDDETRLELALEALGSEANAPQ